MPGGVVAKPDDLNIYGVMRGDAKPAQKPANETLPRQPASPADNANGTIESLIAQTDDPFEAALNVPKSVAEDSSLPPGNSITVLQDNAAVKVSPPRPDLNRAPQADVAAAPPVTPTPRATRQAAKTPQPAAVKPAGQRQDFMVQLAASRSRALARGVYSKLQSNYNDLLGRRDPLILRVDLGNKGIFYRVNVPGFETRNSATQFCANLKKRGQDCLIRKQP